MEAHLKKAMELVFPYFLKLKYNSDLEFSILLRQLNSKIISILEYQDMINQIKDDQVISKHIDKMVGNWYSLSRLEINQIIHAMIQTQCHAHKENNFDKEIFDIIYDDFESFFIVMKLKWLKLSL